MWNLCDTLLPSIVKFKVIVPSECILPPLADVKIFDVLFLLLVMSLGSVCSVFLLIAVIQLPVSYSILCFVLYNNV